MSDRSSQLSYSFDTADEEPDYCQSLYDPYIPQLDGPLSPSTSVIPLSHQPVQPPTLQPLWPSQSLPTNSTTVHQAQYSLNQTKQMDKLKSDSLLQDFNIDISSNQENVNIQCNAGFYSVILRPCLEIFRPEAKF